MKTGPERRRMGSARRRSLLIVEGDPLQALALADAMSLYGYSVTITGEAVEARRVLTEESATPRAYDVIVIDLDTSCADPELMNELADRRRRVPVICLTSFPESCQLVTDLALGAVASVLKPVTGHALHTMIQDELTTSQQRSAQP